MPWWSAPLAAMTAFLCAVALTPLLARWARRRNLLDVPNPRSSHIVATPRTGGAAFVTAALAGAAAWAWISGGLSGEALLTLGAASCLALLGLVDDVRPLPAATRLVVQTAVAAAFVAMAGPVPLPAPLEGNIAIAFTIVWLVGCTNAYNFMDGIDGIAAGQAVVAGVGWALLGWSLASAELVALGLLAAAAPAGFLVHNWPPARVFMGDAGSAFLGFLFAAIPVVAPGNPPTAILWAALLLWPFLFDTGTTLLGRLLRGENVMSAHRSHIYQRLVISGISHGRVSALYVGLASVGLLAALSLATGNGIVAAVGVPLAAIALVWFARGRTVVG